MKKLSIVLCLAAFLGFAFSPVAMSTNNENLTEYTDTTKKAVKKTSPKTDCSKSCSSSSCSKTKKTPVKTEPKKK